MLDWLCENYKTFLTIGGVILVAVYLIILFGRDITGWWYWQRRKK